MTDRGWTLAPLWNEANLFAALPAMVSRPSAIDHAVRPWGKWIAFVLLGILVLMGVSSVWQRISDLLGVAPVAVFGLSIAAGAAVGTWMPPRRWHYAMLALVAAARLPMPEPLRNVRGAFILLAPFWLALHVVNTYYNLGFDRMQLLAPGNDWWQFQRFAYRIYMQGYWLEGGEVTFWLPAAVWLRLPARCTCCSANRRRARTWDAVAILIIALFSFEVVRQLRGFRWGIAAGALALTTYLSGPGHVFIGRGTVGTSSAGFIYLSALCVIAAREPRSPRLLLAAGVFGVLGVWTRLNNLPMALAAAIFAWPLEKRRARSGSRASGP